MKTTALGLFLLATLAVALWALRPVLPDTGSKKLQDFAKLDTVLIYGTSLSAPPYSWPDELGAALAACLDASVQIKRLTKPGAGSLWAKTQIETAIAAQPDAVIMELAINDADLMDGISLADSRKNHEMILMELKAVLPDTQILLMTTGPVQGLQRAKRYFLGRFFRVYSDLAKQFETGLIHTHPYWASIPLADGLHPQNSDASAVMVPQLLDIFAPKRCISNG